MNSTNIPTNNKKDSTKADPNIARVNKAPPISGAYASERSNEAKIKPIPSAQPLRVSVVTPIASDLKAFTNTIRCLLW